MAINSVYPEKYSEQLAAKKEQFQTLFSHFQPPELEVFESTPTHFRMRAEFKVWHENHQAHYAMYQPGETKKPFIIDEFAIGSNSINNLMPKLLEAINRSPLLSKRLFQVEFLTTLNDESVITLIYHRSLDDAWEIEASTLAQYLNSHIIGRSRKQKRIIGKDYVIETLNVNQRPFSYQQVETGFTQPNAGVCEKMLNWAFSVSEGLGGDLLELYCGNGNFTLPLSLNFRQVLATEISKTSVNSALFNINLNNIENVTVVRMSSEEFTQAMDRQREFRRLKEVNLDDYQFSTIFVDPPRAGLDRETLELVSKFDNILYISCNPETLANNMETLHKSHQIKRFALFDQFPYTHHIESGVLLQRR